MRWETKQEACALPARGLGRHPHSLQGLGWVGVRERPGKFTPGWLSREEFLVPFFSECSNPGRLLLSGPLKFRKEKDWTSFQRGKKDNKHTHSAKIKSHPKKTFMKMFLSFKNPTGVGMLLGHRPRGDCSLWPSHWPPCVLVPPLRDPWTETALFSPWEGREPTPLDGLGPTVRYCGWGGVREKCVLIHCLKVRASHSGSFLSNPPCNAINSPSQILGSVSDFGYRNGSNQTPSNSEQGKIAIYTNCYVTRSHDSSYETLLPRAGAQVSSGGSCRSFALTDQGRASSRQPTASWGVSPSWVSRSESPVSWCTLSPCRFLFFMENGGSHIYITGETVNFISWQYEVFWWQKPYIFRVKTFEK